MDLGKTDLVVIAFTLLRLALPASGAAQVQTEVPPAVPGAKPVTVERIRIHGTTLEGNLEGNAVDRDVLVQLPPSYQKENTRRYPVVYALHGFWIGAAQWAQEIHVPQTIEGAFAQGANELIVVLPDAKTLHNGSMYSSSVTTGDFERFIANDVVAYIDAHYRTIPGRTSRGLVGHSMGGYGATRIGMKYPEVFGALYIMSPCCLSARAAGRANPQLDSALESVKTPADVAALPGAVRAQLAAAAAWSPNPKNPPLYLDLPMRGDTVRNDVLARWAANAPLAFIDQYIGNLRQYRGIMIDVGDQDGLRADAARLHEALDRYGIANQFEVYAGTHTSAVAIRFQNHVLPFFSKRLCEKTPCAEPPASPAYLNPALPTEQRVHDLVSRMTLEEKASQMRDRAPAIPRLHVPPYYWWNEAAHGVAAAGIATNFPQTIGMAATWNTRLVHEIGTAISTEARAKYHDSMRRNQPEWFFGLTFWAPNINIFRDPRWGRGMETYGEDPFLAGRMAVAFVGGMQGNDPKHLKVVSTPKHFAVHSGPEPLRHHFNVDVSPHDLEDTYLPAFRAAVTEANARSVMCAYNAVDGVPACASRMLLQDRLRRYWGFDGYVVSDCAALNDVTNGHKYAPDFTHAAAVSLQAGTDLECGFGTGMAYLHLLDAVKQRLITEAQIDTALTRLFTARFRLGMFDPPDSYEYGRIPFSANNSAEHRKLALRAAREAMVMLKNDGVLPLANKFSRIAVVGPTAELVQALQGNYNGTPPLPVYPITGMEERFGTANVSYAQGSVLARGLAHPIAHTALRLKGEYFANPDMSGEPLLVREDRLVNFNWDKTAPHVDMQRHNWSARWTGTFTPPAPGEYRLGAHVNDCWGCEKHELFRLYVDDKLLVDNAAVPNDAGNIGLSPDAAIHFSDTRPRRIRFEYVHYTSPAGIHLTWQPPAAALRAEAVALARRSDVVVAFLGLSPQLEGEEMPVSLQGFSGGDRTDIALPQPQRELLAALQAAGKPIVVVLTAGSAVALDEAHANAILVAWYAGEEGGTAIAETLAGDNNPAGRLPVTFYASLDQLPPFDDYSMANRTYRYFSGRPWRGFGFGLSYSQFAYSNLKLPARPIEADDSLIVELDVRNVSNRAGDEVVEVYLTQPRAALTPIRTLAAFTRVHLEPGETTRIALALSARTLGQVDESGNRVIVPGEYIVYAGSTQPGESAGGVVGSFRVNGTRTLPH